MFNYLSDYLETTNKYNQLQAKYADLKARYDLLEIKKECTMIEKYNAIRSDVYLAWVRTLDCANCGASAPSEAHHKIGHGRVGTVKTHDTEAMPLCTPCHHLLHTQGWVAFEMVNQCQMRMSLETIAKAIQLGILEINIQQAQELSKC